MKHFNAHFMCLVLLYAECELCLFPSVRQRVCFSLGLVCFSYLQRSVEICLSQFSHSVILMMKTENSLLRPAWGIMYHKLQITSFVSFEATNKIIVFEMNKYLHIILHIQWLSDIICIWKNVCIPFTCESNHILHMHIFTWK